MVLPTVSAFFFFAATCPWHEPRGLHQSFYLTDFNATVVSDGVFTLCQNVYNVPDSRFKRIVQHHRNQVFPFTLSENAVVVDISGERVLVDTGAYLPPQFSMLNNRDGGKLLFNLKMAGIDPSSITAVLLTHAHVDHCAGLIATDGNEAFPNAQIYISRIEHNFWQNPRGVDHLPVAFLELEKNVYTRSILPYGDKLNLIEHNESPIAGVTFYLAPGHTPGHCIIEFRLRNSILVVTGDLWHFRELQVPYPNIGMKFDTDAEQAIESRRIYLEKINLESSLVLAYHENFPGLGYVRRKMRRKNRYQWVPANLNDLQPYMNNECT